MAAAAAISTVLAVLPLIISAAEDCFRPFVRYRRFDTEVDRFQQKLKVQKTIFRNQCRFLLENVIEHDAATEMLEGRAHPSWSDLGLDNELATLLGDSREACCIIIRSIDEKLRDIEKESQDLSAIVDGSNAVSQLFHELVRRLSDWESQANSNKIWRRAVGKKLRFCFSKSRLDQIVIDLKSLNDDFRTLSSQTSALLPGQTRSSSNNPKQYNRDIVKYRVIEQTSRQVYAALCKACTKHSEHLAHFCIKVEHEAQDDRPAPQVKFNLAFTSLTLTGSSSQSDPIWFMIDTVIGDTAVGSSVEPVVGIDDLARSLKRELESPSRGYPKKPKKTVRFTSTRLPAPTVPLDAVSNAVVSDPRMRRDFCDYLRSCFHQPMQSNVCMGLLDHTDSCRHFIYPSKDQLRSGRATSLDQFISSVSQQGPAGGLLQFERLHLAKSLATAVLQYHATPWLKVSWRSQDIFFFGLEGNTAKHSRPSLKAPHLHVNIKGPNQALSQTAKNPTRSVARNSLLFNLGVMLLEVAYCATLRSLEQPCDLEDGKRGPLTEIFAARRLAESLGREMGGT